MMGMVTKLYPLFACLFLQLAMVAFLTAIINVGGILLSGLCDALVC